MNIFTELPMNEIIQGMLFILETIAITVLFFSIVHCDSNNKKNLS